MALAPCFMVTSSCLTSALWFVEYDAPPFLALPRTSMLGSSRTLQPAMMLADHCVIVQSLSRVQLFATPWTAARQASLSITSSRSLLKLMSIKLVMSSNYLILYWPFFSCLQFFPASGSFPVSQFASNGQSIGTSTSASVLPKNIQGWFPLGWTSWNSLQSRDSQGSSPTPQFKSINSSVLSLLCGSTLTSMHDYWKNHSFDYTDLCWQSNVSALEYAV